MVANYASQPKHFNVDIISALPNTDTSAHFNEKQNSSSECHYSCRYVSCESLDELGVNKSDLFQLCLNLVKKI